MLGQNSENFQTCVCSILNILEAKVNLKSIILRLDPEPLGIFKIPIKLKKSAGVYSTHAENVRQIVSISSEKSINIFLFASVCSASGKSDKNIFCKKNLRLLWYVFIRISLLFKTRILQITNNVALLQLELLMPISNLLQNLEGNDSVPISVCRVKILDSSTMFGIT